MKGLSAALTLFSASTVTGLVLGIAGGGLRPITASVALLAGVVAAVFAYLRTNDSKSPDTLESNTTAAGTSAPEKFRYRRVWFWILAVIFTMFAVRSFCWLLYIESAELKIQSVNNLGDLALHITYIKDFANGTPLWPANPIYPAGHLRYPAGVDLFNALLSLVNVDLIRGLVWVGLAGAVATFYALYRWGKEFAVAAFLFNGGTNGFEFLHSGVFKDYQAEKIAWKSIPLAMFVTQRGWLYAIPAGLLLLWHWREKFFRSGSDRRGPLPFWVELVLYASMPLFHVHTFLALTIVLLALFFCGDPQMRGHLLTLVGCALLPATFFVWLITDHFHAGSVLEWHPGWVQNIQEFKRHNFVEFWWVNFGIFIPLALLLFGFCAWRVSKTNWHPGEKLPEEVAFLLPALAIFLLALFVKTAPWEWDNLKIMLWSYFLVLPYLWTQLIAKWSVPVRVGVCLALFGSGFVSLFGGLKGGGYGFCSRGELDAVGAITRKLPVEARFAAYPTYNHPLLLQGRNVVLGYPGHLWTQGFDFRQVEDVLKALMLGGVDWQEAAQRLHVRYIFWGREEKLNYPNSARPWERTIKPIAEGPWGAIYDLGEPGSK